MTDFEQLTSLLKAHREAAVLASLPLRHATIMLAGLFEGVTARFLLEMHPDSFLHCYEPQEAALARASVLLSDYTSRTRLVSAALGVTAGRAGLAEIGTDRCHLTEGSVCEVVDFVEEMHVLFPDVLFLNVEGAEYPLLEALVQNRDALSGRGALPRHVIVQLHGTTEDNKAIQHKMCFDGWYSVAWQAGNWCYWTL